MNDMKIKEVIEHLQNNYSTIPKSFKKHISKLNINYHILYYNHHDNLVIVAPKVMRNVIMQLGHSQFYSGHFGAFKTHQRILEDAWWPNMFANIREYIQNCKVCIMVNAENRKKGRLGLREFPKKPMELVSIDFIVDLPITNQSNIHILTIHDFPVSAINK